MVPPANQLRRALRRIIPGIRLLPAPCHGERDIGQPVLTDHMHRKRAIGRVQRPQRPDVCGHRRRRAAAAARIMGATLTVSAMEFTRITIDPARMGGVPIIRNLRIPVATVVDMVADGMSEAEILQAYPDLEAPDITEALRFAAEAVREREIPLLSNR